ncbi:ATP synthase subunit I [Methylomonas paludis]|uniref:ATP synthase subunit I n=1 Tax=Methylomonas paludis TaxID=1173101 RepID=A0A975MNC8_9GAMM|nr:ATP synthase subunit I [Methylomonas paludis]QWF70829.1 ATP synthase subunit I [Methylomonas paludis]
MAVENKFSTVGKILYGQILMTLVIALGFFWLGGWQSTISPLLGGGIALLPNVYFAYKIYLARDLPAQGILNAFYAGETIKLVLTAALFAVVVVRFPAVDFLALLTAYVAVLSVFWFALFFWRD